MELHWSNFYQRQRLPNSLLLLSALVDIPIPFTILDLATTRYRICIATPENEFVFNNTFEILKVIKFQQKYLPPIHISKLTTLNSAIWNDRSNCLLMQHLSQFVQNICHQRISSNLVTTTIFYSCPSERALTRTPRMGLFFQIT